MTTRPRSYRNLASRIRSTRAQRFPTLLRWLAAVFAPRERQPKNSTVSWVAGARHW